jgi:hypothetical protein
MHGRLALCNSPSPTEARSLAVARRAFHSQLKELWEHPPLASNKAEWLSPPSASDPEAGSALRHTGQHSFAVIVMQRFNLVAELKILMLRPEYPGRILQRADIDNRLKTLFDALRYPDNSQEVPTSWIPSADEQPLFCLLEDDRLVTRVNVEADRLLNAAAPDEVMLTIQVQLRVTSPTWATIGLV